MHSFIPRRFGGSAPCPWPHVRVELEAEGRDQRQCQASTEVIPGFPPHGRRAEAEPGVTRRAGLSRKDRGRRRRLQEPPAGGEARPLRRRVEEPPAEGDACPLRRRVEEPPAEGDACPLRRR